MIGIDADILDKINAHDEPRGQCSNQRRQQSHDERDKQCNEKRVCTTQMDLATLQANRLQRVRCAFARHHINVECFDGGDSKHKDLVEQEMQGIRRCDDILEEMMKKNFKKGKLF